jgi:hypothetical protein
MNDDILLKCNGIYLKCKLITLVVLHITAQQNQPVMYFTLVLLQQS